MDITSQWILRSMSRRAAAGKSKSSEPAISPKKAARKGRCEQAKPLVKQQPCKQDCRTGLTSQDTEPKASGSTETLPVITARKGTQKYNAQLKKLVDALAAKEACDDMYQSQVLKQNIPDDFFGEAGRDEVFNIDVTNMKTPPLFSPAITSPNARFSFRSSPSEPSGSQEAAVAITQGLRKQDHATTLESDTPKRKFIKKKLVARNWHKLEIV